MKTLLFILTSFVFVYYADAQTETEESLLQKLADASNDSMRAETYISLHNITFISDLNKSRDYAKQVLSVGLRTGSFKFIQKGYYELSRCGRKRRDYSEVMPYDFLMLKYAKQANAPEDIFNAYRLIATDYMDDEKTPLSLPYIDTCRQVVSARLNTPYYNGRVNQLYGWYYSNQNQSRLALPYFKNALNSYQAAGDDKMTAELEYALGDCFLTVREPDSACVYAYKAIDIYKKRNSVGRQADCYDFLGKCYTLNGNTDKGIESYRMCIELDKQVLDSPATSLACIDLARLYLLKNDTVAALGSAREAESRIQKLNYPECNVELNTFWGQYFLAITQLDKANDYFKQAYEQAVQNNLPEKKIEIEKYWAQLRYKEKKNKDGDSLVYSYVKQLLASREPNTINREVATLLKRNPHLDSSSIATIKLLYSPGGADYLKKKLGLNGLSSVINIDSIINLDPNSQGTTKFDSLTAVSDNHQQLVLETQYRTRIYIDSLQIEKQNRQFAEAEIQKRNIILTCVSISLFLLASGFYLQYKNRRRAERDKIRIENDKIRIENDKIKIEGLQHRIHHNLDNALATLQIFIDESVEKDGTTISPAVLQNRISAIKLLHSRLYQDNLVGDVFLQTYLTELSAGIANVYETGKDITILIQTPITLSSDVAQNVGVIANEVISNSYKYAFDNCEHGTIKVETAVISDRHYKLTIADNGRGFTTLQTDGYGMKLIAGLTKEMKGTFNYENDNGTRFTLYFSDEN